jgi:DNA-binding CsgD family transcriptional regulator
MEQVDLRRAFSAIGLVAEATTAQALASGVLASVSAVISADSVIVTQFGFIGPTITTWPADFLTGADAAAFERLHGSEPWPLAVHTRVGPGNPIRISDVFSQQQFRARAIYAELFHALGIEYQVAFSVEVDSHHALCVAANRSAGDFSEADVERLDALRRPLAAGASRIARSECSVVGIPDAAPDLSKREADVLALVASGLTNDEVGRRLGISARTVSKHLEHIFAKSGSRNRTQAAAFWHGSDGAYRSPLRVGGLNGTPSYSSPASR